MSGIPKTIDLSEELLEGIVGGQLMSSDLGLPKTLGRLGKNSVIGLPNPHESSRPAAITM